jgi:hypothetical protein
MKQSAVPRPLPLFSIGQSVKWTCVLLLFGTGVFNLATQHRYEGLAALASLVILLTLTALIKRIFPGPLRSWLYMAVDLYIVEATILGTVLHLYGTTPYYDKINHGMFGSMAAVIALLILYRVNPSQRNQLTLQPGFVAIFCLGFTMTFKIIWEFYEFTADRLFNTNMQGWQHGGITGLTDTMTDLATGMACALVVCLFIRHQLKKGANHFYQKYIRGFF